MFPPKFLPLVPPYLPLPSVHNLQVGCLNLESDYLELLVKNNWIILSSGGGGSPEASMLLPERSGGHERR